MSKAWRIGLVLLVIGAAIPLVGHPLESLFVYDCEPEEARVGAGIAAVIVGGLISIFDFARRASPWWLAVGGVVMASAGVAAAWIDNPCIHAFH